MTDGHGVTRHSPDPLARRLLSRYLERRRSDVAMLRRALENGEFGAIEVSGHNMFGSGSAYGFDIVTDIGRQLEEAARGRQPAAIAALIDDLEGFLRHVETP